jgi:hypothetical protein
MPRPVAFPFVVDALAPLSIVVKPFFGGHMVYLPLPNGAQRMLFMLHDNEKYPAFRGVWVATAPEHLPSLQAQFAALEPVPIGEFTDKAWRMVRADHDDFESTVTALCACIKRGDVRLGRVPDARAARKPAQKTAPKTVANNKDGTTSRRRITKRK